jgi:hypothetical protein
MQFCLVNDDASTAAWQLLNYQHTALRLSFGKAIDHGGVEFSLAR